MARAIPPERFARLIAAAVQVFIDYGFKQAQMEEVAVALGVAKGTVYRYVASKHALLFAVIRHADGHVPMPAISELPIATPEPGAIGRLLSERIASELSDLALIRALGTEDAPDPRAELNAVVRDLYRRVHSNRCSIKVADRSARDFPELAEVFFTQARFGQVTMLADLVRRRARAGLVKSQIDPAIIARNIIETIMFWACDRYWDPSPQTIDESAVEDAVVALCIDALF